MAGCRRGTGLCSGTLIAPDVVLTAGHCAEIDPRRVIANATDFKSGGVFADVIAVLPYPDWSSTYDIAVLVLGEPVAGVAPRAIGAACTFQTFATGTRVHVVGFGLTDDAGTGANSVLHEATVPVTDALCDGGGEGCQPAVAPGGEFVAGGGGVDSCNGDSGGPVYLDTPRGPVAIGVVSRGVAGAATICGGGGIYVRTDHVIDWIRTATGAAIAVDACGQSGSAADGTTAVAYGQVVGPGCAAAGPNGPAFALAFVLVFVAVTMARRRRCA